MQEFTHKSNYSLQRIMKGVTSDLGVGGIWERFRWILLGKGDLRKTQR